MYHGPVQEGDEQSQGAGDRLQWPGDFVEEGEVGKGRRVWIESLLDEDEGMEKIVKNEKQHALVSQEYQPLGPQPAQRGQYVSHSERT